MKGLLKIAGRISLLIFVFNVAIHSLVSIGTAVAIIIGGIILQRINDSLFRLSITSASLLFFLWSIT